MKKSSCFNQSISKEMDPDFVQWLWAYAMMLGIDPNNKTVMKTASPTQTEGRIKPASELYEDLGSVVACRCKSPHWETGDRGGFRRPGGTGKN